MYLKDQQSLVKIASAAALAAVLAACSTGQEVATNAVNEGVEAANAVKAIAK